MTSPIDPESLQVLIRNALRDVKYPGYTRDIVSFGFVSEIAVQDGSIRIGLVMGTAQPETAFRIQADVRNALTALPQLQGTEIKIEMTHRSEATAPGRNGHEIPISPLQDELQQSGTGFDPDPLLTTMVRPDLAPDAGYGEDGPSALGGPAGDRTSMKWKGAVPVFQWEIDPSDPQRQHYGEHEVERDGWLFRVWWQVHPAGLVYASISAISDEEEERPHARLHPVGRSVAVNLVYDLRREGVVAVYGTALDFRPFVEVFLQGFAAAQSDHAGAGAPAQENSS